VRVTFPVGTPEPLCGATFTVTGTSVTIAVVATEIDVTLLASAAPTPAAAMVTELFAWLPCTPISEDRLPCSPGPGDIVTVTSHMVPWATAAEVQVDPDALKSRVFVLVNPVIFSAALPSFVRIALSEGVSPSASVPKFNDPLVLTTWMFSAVPSAK
jgi:hypothetical protein